MMNSQQTPELLARELDRDLQHILLAIAASAAPLGSRQLVQAAFAEREAPSEATMARRLRELDALGLTYKMGQKGRVATDLGGEVASSIRRGEVHARQLRDASKIRTAQDLLHLLHARRAVEPEGVRGATEGIRSNPLSGLKAIVEMHRKAMQSGAGLPRDLAMAFHREIANATPNPIVKAMLNTVLSDEMDTVEAVLDAVLEARRHADHSVDEHDRIAALIAEGDAEGAAAAMREHIDRLIHEVTGFLADNDTGLIESLLAARVR